MKMSLLMSGGRAGCRGGPRSRVGCESIPVEVFKLLKGTLRRCHYKAALCKIDLGSDVTARSRGECERRRGAPAAPPLGGKRGAAGGGWVGRRCNWPRGVFWTGSAWEKLPEGSRTLGEP